MNAAKNTSVQYDNCLAICKKIFLNKAKDYGTSWRVYRTISIADQIYIKAWRIRQLQEGIIQQIEDTDESEFMAIVNYGIIGNILLLKNIDSSKEIPLNEVEQHYDETASNIKALMMQKNNDYGEAWRNMSFASFVDLILTKILRIRQIIQNEGNTISSEGIDANFADIVNYAMFALILKAENKNK